MKPKITVPAILASMLVAGLMFVQAAHVQSPPGRIEATAKRFDSLQAGSVWKRASRPYWC
jgi:hypothetical protein